MSKFVAILLMISLGFQSLVKIGMVAWYQVNKDYIAKNLCENRNKPQMKCCGKCYLRKQLKKADNNNTPARHVPGKSERSEIVDFVLPGKIVVQRIFDPLSTADWPTVGGSPLADFASSVFHPPSVGC